MCVCVCVFCFVFTADNCMLESCCAVLFWGVLGGGGVTADNCMLESWGVQLATVC